MGRLKLRPVPTASREQVFFVGDATAPAVAARHAKLRARLGPDAGPLSWLTAVLSVILGRKIEGPVQASEARRFARAVLRGLGYDPDAHQLSRRKGRAFVVRDARGRLVQAYSARDLQELAGDVNFLAEYGEEMGAGA